MKVVVITHNYIRRQGDLTALYLHRLSSGLISKGIEITVVCPHASGLLKEDTIDGVRIKRFTYPFSGKRPLAYTGNMHEIVSRSLFAKLIFVGLLYSMYRFGLQVCLDEKPDLIWANWWIPPGLAASKIASKLNLPLIISSHGTDIALLDKPGITQRLSRYVYNRTQRATVVSNFLKNKLINSLPVFSKEKVEVIPMPVGMETFLRKPFNDEGVPVFLSVARYTKQKHLDSVIEAADILNKAGFEFKIDMVGEGPLEGELKNLITEKNLENRIKLGPLVAQQKLAKLYQECDAVLLVSENEGFGLVLVEAGLTGRPTIGANSGGIVDFIKHNRNGLLIEVGDHKALAEGMKSIITDRQLRNRLGEGAYQTARDKFATPDLVDKMYNLFESTVNYWKRK
ncbi:MAG: glycosyltransferase family 4 protein [candidate division Zixibacteria bacterium]